MAFAANNDVIMNGNAKALCGVHDLSGHVDISTARGGIAGGVIVNQHNGGCRQVERALADLADINRGVVDGAFLLNFVGNDAVFLVEKDNSELFAGFMGHRGVKIIEQC